MPFIINAFIGSIFILSIARRINRNRFLEQCSAYSLPFYAFQNQLVIPVVARFSTKIVDVLGINISFIRFGIDFVLSIVLLYIICALLDRKVPWTFKGVSVVGHNNQLN